MPRHAGSCTSGFRSAASSPQCSPSGCGASTVSSPGSSTSTSVNTQKRRSPVGVTARTVASTPPARTSSVSIAVMPGRSSGVIEPRSRPSSRSRNPTRATSLGSSTGAPTTSPHARGPRPSSTATGMSAASPPTELTPSYRSMCPSRNTRPASGDIDRARRPSRRPGACSSRRARRASHRRRAHRRSPAAPSA